MSSAHLRDIDAESYVLHARVHLRATYSEVLWMIFNQHIRVLYVTLRLRSVANFSNRGVALRRVAVAMNGSHGRK